MKRSSEKEMMDWPGQPKELLADGLHNLRIINHYLGSYRNVLRGLARLVDEEKLHRFTLLDVGTGSGDIPMVIVRWARRQQIAAQISGLEREAATVEEAVDQTRSFPEITIVRGDGTAPPFCAGSFDFVLASQFLHHFKDEQIIALLRTWARLARRAIIVADLVRHPVAYHGIRLLTHGFTDNPMTRFDAPLSVQRACTISEWNRLLQRANIGTLRIQRMFPFRMLALISPLSLR